MKKITHRLICMMLVSCMLFNSMTSMAFAFDREESVSFEELTPDTLDLEMLSLLETQNTDQCVLLVEDNALAQVSGNYDSQQHTFNVNNIPTEITVMLAGYSRGQMVALHTKESHNGSIQWTLPKGVSLDTIKAFFLDDNHVPVCDAKEYYLASSLADDLVVADFHIDRDHIMTGEPITLMASANRFSNDLTYFAAFYMGDKKVDQIISSGSLTYTPNETGVFSLMLEAVDEYGKSYFSYFEDVFTVVPYWSASGVSVSSDSLSVGEKITFSIANEGNLNDTSISFNIYKDGLIYREIEDVSKSKYTLATTEPGIYYCKVDMMDNHGNHTSFTSENVTVTRKEYFTENYNSSTYQGKINVSDVLDKSTRDVRVADENLVIEWERLTDDAYYKVDIDCRKKNLEVANIKNYTSNSYTILASDLYPGYEYVVIISRYNSAGKVISRYDFDFVVVGGESILLEAYPDIIAPANYASVNYDDLVIQWTKMAYAATIEITLGYKCGSDKHEIFKHTVTGDTTTYTIPKDYLYEGKQHEIEIVAKDSLGNESSDDKYFYVGCEGDSDLFEIEEPVLTSGFLADGYYRDKIPTYPVYEPIEITWEDNPAASYFSLHITDYETDDELVYDYISDNFFCIPPTDLTSGNRYEVRVYAHHTADCYDTSDRLWFRAPYHGNLTLDPPVISSPELTQEIDSIYSFVKQDLTITWKPVSAAVTYGVEVYETADRDWVDFETTGLTSPSVTIPKGALITGVPYAILIYAYDSNGNYTYEKYYLQMVSSSIDPPILLSPVLPTDEEATLPTMSEDDLILVWGSVDGAVKYRVKLWEFWSDDWDDIFTAEDITQTTCTIPEDELYEGGLFKVRITAYDQFGNTRVSSPYYFQIGDSGYLELSKESFNFDYKADKETLKITSSSAWTAQPSASWITLNNTYGDASMTLTVNVDENTGDFPRSGSITFTNSAGGYAVFAVTQNGNGSSNSGSLEITSPEQGDTIDYAKFRAAWKWKYDFAYFKVTLTDVASGGIVHSADRITSRYTDIPQSVLSYGHTYQLTVAVYNAQHISTSTSSIIFRTENGDNIEDIPPKEDGDLPDTEPVYAILSGRVIDDKGAALEGVLVSISEDNKQIGTASTNSNGVWSIADAVVGHSYMIRCSATKYKFVPEQVQVTIAQGENLLDDFTASAIDIGTHEHEILHTAPSVYVRHNYEPIENDSQNHNAVAIVWEVTCAICGELFDYYDTQGYEGSELPFQESHMYDDSGFCWKCGYSCDHNYIPLDEYKTGSGKWENCGDGTHKRVSVVQYFKCSECDIKTGIRVNESSVIQKHIARTENGEKTYQMLDSTDSNYHTKHQVSCQKWIYCSARNAGCNYKAKGKLETLNEDHNLVNGRCICGYEKPVSTTLKTPEGFVVRLEYSNEQGDTTTLLPQFMNASISTTVTTLPITFSVLDENGKALKDDNVNWHFYHETSNLWGIGTSPNKYGDISCTLEDYSFNSDGSESIWTCTLYKKGNLFGYGEETLYEFTLKIDRLEATKKRFQMSLSVIEDYSDITPGDMLPGFDYECQITNWDDINPKIGFSVIDLSTLNEINGDDLSKGSDHRYCGNVGEGFNFYLTLDDNTSKKYRLAETKEKNGEVYLTSNSAIKLIDVDLSHGAYHRKHTIHLWRDNYIIDSYTVGIRIYDSDYKSPKVMFSELSAAATDSLWAILAGVAINSYIAVDAIIYQVTDHPDLGYVLKRVGAMGEVNGIIAEHIVADIVLEDLVGYDDTTSHNIYWWFDAVGSMLNPIDATLYTAEQLSTIEELQTDRFYTEETIYKANGLMTIIDFFTD